MKTRRSGAVREGFGSGDHTRRARRKGEQQDMMQKSKNDDFDQLSPDVEMEVTVDDNSLIWYLLGKINIILGVTVMCLVGCFYAWYIYTLHENRLWFSNILEVEREISFRTEAGLYYSYYKQMVQVPSFWQGWHKLKHDITTESWRKINVLNRFNIYQEVLLAVIYRYLPYISNNLSPIFFYIHFIFALHGIYLMTLFGLGWLLGNSWLSGLLASAFYVCNRSHTTRVEFTIPLRESFSIPLLYMQLLFVTLFLKSSSQAAIEKLKLAAVFISTVAFTITWQFSQFLLLLQGVSLYLCTFLGIIPPRKTESLLLCIAVTIPLVAYVQFNNRMLQASMAQSFSLAANLELHSHVYKGPGFFKNIGWKCYRAVLVLGLTLVFYLITKSLVRNEDDQHIIKFMWSKFGYSNESDFDVLLYLCNSSFKFMPWSMLEELSRGLVFLLYVPTTVVLLLIIIVTVYRNWANVEGSKLHFIISRPELCYHTIQSALFGVMAAVVMRMKYVWTPQICVIAAFGVGCRTAWRIVLAKIGFKSKWLVEMIRNSALVIVFSLLVSRSLPTMTSELGVLSEFYDPDTVELMNWINQQTPKGSSFSGSMQLLAGVKLCTGRRVTNHPHFEDKLLRNITFQLYQFYAKRSVEEVHDIHSRLGTNFIILEDSICLPATTNQGCRLIDIMDKANGHPPDYTEEGQTPGGDKAAESGVIKRRFCRAIKQQTAKQIQYFKKVFQNKTFKIYQVM